MLRRNEVDVGFGGKAAGPRQGRLRLAVGHDVEGLAGCQPEDLAQRAHFGCKGCGIFGKYIEDERHGRIFHGVGCGAYCRAHRKRQVGRGARAGRKARRHRRQHGFDQVYHEVRILTARPSPDDEARVPHALYGHVGVDEAYSVARFQADAARALAEARGQGRMPVFTGGTGLYFDALTEGLADIPAVPADVRARTQALRDEIGADAFHAELARRDPETAARLNASDTQRMLRAFEVVLGTGTPLSTWQRAKPAPGPLAGLRLARFVVSPDRAELHRRIDRRFDAMLEAGAMDEARALGGLDPALPAAKILGLRELQAVLAGTTGLEEARAAAQAQTRQYAKRQLTWFRNRMGGWAWPEPDVHGNFLSEFLSRLA